MAELDLEKLVKMVEVSADLTENARLLAERDKDYYDGHQWTREEIATLNARKQPVITINRIRRKVDAMVGIEQRSRVDPRAYGRTPQDEDAADVATKALVYVDDATRFDSKRSAAFKDLIVSGYGGVEIGVEEKNGQLEVCVTRLRWEEIFYDPHSREEDFSDATYMGVMKWMSMDAALEWLAMFGAEESPDVEAILDAALVARETGETYDDRPFEDRGFRWADKRQKRVRVTQMYYRRSGVWYLAVFTKGGAVFNAPSPYLDEDGQPTNPMILMSAYVDRDNARHGVVRDMISPQDEVNKRRSKLLHMLNSRQTIGEKGAVDSVSSVKREMAKPDGHVEVTPGMRFDIVPNVDQVSGQASLLQEAKGEIDMVGPNASLLGQLQGDQSGRAILAQQQAGLVELWPIYDALRDWTIRCYKAMWQRVRQFWTQPRWVRITDDINGAQYLGVNVPVGVDQMGRPIFENVLAEMNVDIIIEEAPDYVTLRQEQFQQLVEMVQAGVPVPPQMMIEASSLRDKRRLMEALQPDPQAAQMAQAAAMLEMEGKAAEVEETRAGAEKDRASAMKDLHEINMDALSMALGSRAVN